VLTLKLFISRLENDVMSQLPKEHTEWAASDKGNLRKFTENMNLLQHSLQSRFFDFAKQDRIFALINPFSFGELQMVLIDLKTNSTFRTKSDVDELPSVPGSEICLSRSLPCGYFPELSKFAQSYIIYRFGTTYTCQPAFWSMKLIKSKTTSRLTDSNLKNSPQLLSATNISPNLVFV